MFRCSALEPNRWMWSSENNIVGWFRISQHPLLDFLFVEAPLPLWQTVLFCEMFHAWLNTMLSFTDCLSVAASLEKDVISLSFTGQSMISWDSLRETAVAANWPKMIVGDADKQWQALLVGETAWELGFLISEVGGGGLDLLSQPRQLASPHLLLKEIKQRIGKYLHRADPFKHLLCGSLGTRS